MAGITAGLLDTIGGTRLVPLRRLAPPGGARILVKLESENPTGSMKDRMAQAVIAAAIADGRLRPGGAIVEYTGGSTGVSLALVCAAAGHPLHLVTSDAFAREKRDQMRILGAHLTLVPSDDGRMTGALTRAMVAAARQIADTTGAWWVDQLANADALPAYRVMADEIWHQAGGRVDALVHGVGTAASLRGLAEGLRRYDPRVQIVGVEPAESPVLSGGVPGAHKIDGIGAGFVVPLWQAGLADRIERVATDAAIAMALRLAREEALFAGISTGASLVAALRLAAQLPRDATIVTVMADSGMKYLATYGARLDRADAALSGS